MAIYHFHAGIVKRSSKNSAVAAAAYCSGSTLTDDRKSRTYDFSKKTGVVYSKIFLPIAAPNWLSERNKLWNIVELSEKRVDAQIARIFDIALPKELTQAQNWQLTQDFVQSQFIKEGMIADVNVHYDNQNNPHVHIIVTMRQINYFPLDNSMNNIFLNKVRDWNKKEYLLTWRKSWADICNRYLAQYQLSVRIDHRSYSDRDIKQEPTKHIGRAHAALKYSNKKLLPVRKNEAIKYRNSLRSNSYLEKCGFFSQKLSKSTYFVGSCQKGNTSLKLPL